MRARDESLEQLSQTLKHDQLRKVITQGYSDVSLSVMADFKKEYAAALVDSSFSPITMNKLTEAYADNKISADDLYHITKYSTPLTRNEPYVDAFLASIDEGVHHETAAKVFAAVEYERCSYSYALAYVKSGAFYPTDYASLSITDKVAEQLHEIGVPLRACEGFNYCYDVGSLKEAFDNKAAIFVKDKVLAVKVNEMMKLPDWDQFRDEVRYIMGQNIDELTGEKLSELRDDYVREKCSIALYEKVKAEYDCFIGDIKKELADVIVASAYEIVSKDNITMYCQEYTPELTERQYAALLSSKNTLNEIYEQWCNNGELHGLEDIGVALAETADRIQVSIDRTRNEQQKKMQAELSEQAVIEKTPAVKPKHKSR